MLILPPARLSLLLPIALALPSTCPLTDLFGCGNKLIRLPAIEVEGLPLCSLVVGLSSVAPVPENWFESRPGDSSPNVERAVLVFRL